MRNLSAKQKKELTKVLDQYGTNWQLYADKIEAIYDLNPHECYDSNAKRFLQDLYFERLYKRA